ncbi:MAG: hypothetical protein EXR70_19850 [Deltaproteobacteria bacterium]|nr:hypothetical protein [Deltaproteobacteria bacterium]
MEKPDRFETTLGDLIAAASEVAFEYSDNEQDAYLVAQVALVEMLKKTAPSLDLNKQFDMLASPSQRVH